MEKYLIADFNKYEEIEHKYGREPVIEKMPNGTIVCIVTTGGPTEPHNENFVVITKSYDNGKTWTPLEKLFAHKNRGVWATEIYTGYEHPMIVLYTYEGNCPYKELQTFVSYTYDNGESWSSPVSIMPYANGLCLRKGIKMSNGETIFPIYHTELYEKFGKFPERDQAGFWDGQGHVCGVVVSADNGKSYIPYGDFRIEQTGIKNEEIDGRNIGTSTSLWEPNCIEAENGHIIMYMRDSHKPYINAAESFDYGRTWTHIGNTDLPNGNSKLDMFKIKDTLFLVANITPSLEWDGRTELKILSSKDNGKSWDFVCYVGEPDEHIFYPHSFVDNEKKLVYIAYENARQHYLNIYTFEELGI